MKGVLALMACTVAFVSNAHATIDYCVRVRNTPDGFIALREGPGAQSRVKARLKPGELLITDAESTGPWTFVNSVLSRDRGKTNNFTQGWVARKFTESAPACTRALHS